MRRPAWRRPSRASAPRPNSDALALVLKTFHTTHGGKMSVARLLAGQVTDGTTFHTPAGEAGRVSGVFKVMGQHFDKRGPAVAGETVAFGKLDHAKTGDTLSAGKQAHAALVEVTPYAPVLALAVQAKERKDDVKLGAAFSKLTEEDPSLSVVHNAENHEVVIWGQGEMHLRVAAERLGDRYAVPVTTKPPTVGYQRDHPQAGDRARAAQEAVRRPRPVRRHGAGDQAAAARLRLQVRGPHHRRRGAAQLHPGGGGGRDRRRSSTARSASRWSISRWR